MSLEMCVQREVTSQWGRISRKWCGYGRITRGTVFLIELPRTARAKAVLEDGQPQASLG